LAVAMNRIMKQQRLRNQGQLHSNCFYKEAKHCKTFHVFPELKNSTNKNNLQFIMLNQLNILNPVLQD